MPRFPGKEEVARGGGGEARGPSRQLPALQVAARAIGRELAGEVFR